MKKNAFFTLICLLLAAWGQSQNLVNVAGLVSKLSDGSPVANQQIYCAAGDSINPVFGEAITDQNGLYSIALDVPAGINEVYVYTWTNCDPNGNFAEVAAPIANGQAQADFQVCDDSFPPFQDCFADFYFNPIDSLTFQFTGFYYSFLDSAAVGTAYLWDFGDGTTSTEESPVHTYAQSGVYTVTLTITGSTGCVSTVAYPFDTDFNSFPDCMGYVLYNQTSITSFDFSAEIYDANGNIIQANSYLWDFGDGSTSTDPAPSHTYAAEGVYTVLLDAETADGCEVHSCNVVFAYNCPIDTFLYGCQAMFYVGIGDSIDPNQPPLDPLTLHFYDASLGGAITWNWDFGDGATSTEQNPTHTYAAAGNYTVTFSITTLSGCESQASFEICVGNDCWGGPEFDCQALFIPLPDSIGGNGLQFIDLSYSPNPIQSWSWDFGDGTTSNEQNPYHVYAQPGIYIVTLSIQADSCSSVISFEIDSEHPWNYSNSGDPAKLGVATGAVATKEPFAIDGIKLFPNPAQTDLSLAFNSKKEMAYELRISDLTGKTISVSAQEANAGINAVRVNVANLVPGLYLAEIKSAEGMRSMKFVKQ